MKVVHSVAWYPPYSVGGTEVYLESLIEELAALGIESVVLVPQLENMPQRYRHRGCRVETYPVGKRRSTSIADGPHEGFGLFQTGLLNEGPAIFHQHSWTAGCGLNHLRFAKQKGFPTVLTAHLPNLTCLRGTMMRFGETPCDGLIESTRCGACYIQGHGVPYLAARAFGALPLWATSPAKRLPGRLKTVIGARRLGDAKQVEFSEMVANTDKLIAVCDWERNAFLLNGAPASKVLTNRQGLSESSLSRIRGAESCRNKKTTFNILFVGRADPVKGLDLLVRAAMQVSLDVEFCLTIHTVASGPAERAYDRNVRELASGDRRVVFAGPVEHRDLGTVLASHHALAVPSICLETGPLVVLEAQASGLFILGADLGGIAELVQGSSHGLLVEPGDQKAWTAAIEELAKVYSKGALQSVPRQVRSMATVAREMRATYQDLRSAFST